MKNVIIISSIIIISIIISIIFFKTNKKEVSRYSNNNSNYNNSSNSNTRKIDRFISSFNDPLKDGKMKFDYLTNKKYSQNIVDKYYLNDDTRINRVRTVYHPYQVRNNPLYGLAPRLNLTIKDSDKLYNDYGVRL
jgi:hypothetical protein